MQRLLSFVSFAVLLASFARAAPLVKRDDLPAPMIHYSLQVREDFLGTTYDVLANGKVWNDLTAIQDGPGGPIAIPLPPQPPQPAGKWMVKPLPGFGPFFGKEDDVLVKLVSSEDGVTICRTSGENGVLDCAPPEPVKGPPLEDGSTDDSANIVPDEAPPPLDREAVFRAIRKKDADQEGVFELFGGFSNWSYDEQNGEAEHRLSVTPGFERKVQVLLRLVEGQSTELPGDPVDPEVPMQSAV